MKSIFLVFFTVVFFSCGTSNEKAPVTDSANAIEDRPLQDTQPAPFPDGYAPPNTKTDTTQNEKDSIDTVRHRHYK